MPDDWYMYAEHARSTSSPVLFCKYVSVCMRKFINISFNSPQNTMISSGNLLMSWAHQNWWNFKPSTKLMNTSKWCQGQMLWLGIVKDLIIRLTELCVIELQIWLSPLPCIWKKFDYMASTSSFTERPECGHRVFGRKKKRTWACSRAHIHWHARRKLLSASESALSKIYHWLEGDSDELCSVHFETLQMISAHQWFQFIGGVSINAKFCLQQSVQIFSSSFISIFSLLRCCGRGLDSVTQVMQLTVFGGPCRDWSLKGCSEHGTGKSDWVQQIRIRSRVTNWQMTSASFSWKAGSVEFPLTASEWPCSWWIVIESVRKGNSLDIQSFWSKRPRKKLSVVFYNIHTEHSLLQKKFGFLQRDWSGYRLYASQHSHF